MVLILKVVSFVGGWMTRGDLKNTYKMGISRRTSFGKFISSSYSLPKCIPLHEENEKSLTNGSEENAPQTEEMLSSL